MKNRSAGSLPKRLCIYTSERFPLASHSVAILAFFLSAYLTAQALSNSSVRVRWEAVSGFVALVLVFFHVRIMDEFKDAREDAEYHPERPVPRGLITLRELGGIGIAAVIVEIGLSLWMGVLVLLAYSVVLLFTFLMYREFFLGNWLRKNPVLYTVSHIVIVPLLACYVYAIQAFRNTVVIQPAFGFYLALSFAVGLLLEIATKIFPPPKEGKGVGSRSKFFGAASMTYAAVGMLFIGTVSATFLGRSLGFAPYYYAGIWAVFIAAVGGFVRFRLSPTARTSRHLIKLYAPIYMLGVYGLTIVQVILNRSIALELLYS
ncbi:MAG: UbiA family prenyltransferase [Desulfatiglandales bacterium]